MNNYFRSLQQVDIFQGYAPENVFILSDLHLFHTNVIKYTERPFEFSALGCKKMNEYLLSQFENLPENCLVWNLGDVLLNRHVSEGEAMSTIWRTKKNRKLNLILEITIFNAIKVSIKIILNILLLLGLMKFIIDLSYLMINTFYPTNQFLFQKLGILSTFTDTPIIVL